MTVLQLISSEGYYGAESMLVALARALAGLGWEAVVGVLADRRFGHTEVAEEARRLGLRAEIVPCRGRWDRRDGNVGRRSTHTINSFAAD